MFKTQVEVATDVIKVIICDDHKIFRGGVKTALSRREDILFIAEAENGEELLKILKEEQPDVILLDIQMPVLNGIATLPEIKKLYPKIKVIILSMEDHDLMINKMMQLGANAFLSKSADQQMIYDAILSCYQNDYYFNTLTSHAMLSNVKSRSRTINLSPQDLDLSPKEIEVLKLICEEKTSKEIGERLDMSHRTVEAIKERLKTKTGSENMIGLIIYAVKNNIIY